MTMWPGTLDEAKPLIAEAIEHFGTFHAASIDWLAPFVLASGGPGDWNTFTAIVRGGDPVSAEEKAALGHPTWFTFGRPCWDRMSDIGRRDPRAAIEQILEHVSWRQRLVHRRAQFVDLMQSGPTPGRPLYPEVSVCSDHLCCRAAQAIDGVRFSADHYPDLPLPGCDQLWCKCDWQPVRCR